MTTEERIGNTIGILGLIALPIVVILIIYLNKKAQVGGESMRGRVFGRGFGQARPNRGKGIPLDNIERAMRHYNISREEYLAHPEAYPLPDRGTGLYG